MIEGWSFIDAAHMSILMLSTVGFSETHLLSFTGRVFTVLLIMGGAAPTPSFIFRTATPDD